MAGGTFRGGNVDNNSAVTAVTAATARSNAASVAADVFWTPLTLRTY